MESVLERCRVIIADTADSNRIHNKGRYGEPLPGGGLSLHPLEAAYLMESRNLVVRDAGGKIMDLPEVVMAGENCRTPGVSPLHLYTVFRELRRSGLPAFFATTPSDYYHMDLYERGTATGGVPSVSRMTVFPEGCFPGPGGLSRMVRKSSSLGKDHMVAMVDGDLDVTYYSILDLAPEELTGYDFTGLLERSEELERSEDYDREDGESHTTGTESDGGYRGKGSGRSRPYEKLSGKNGPSYPLYFPGAGVVVRDTGKARSILEKFRAGTPMAGGYLFLTLTEAMWLREQGILEMGKPHDDGLKSDLEDYPENGRELYHLYSILRETGLVPRTGFKYGGHFRIYKGTPEEGHAPFLVHLVRDDGKESMDWRAVSKGVRLAHAVKKIMLFAYREDGEMRFLAVVRTRP